MRDGFRGEISAEKSRLRKFLRQSSGARGARELKEERGNMANLKEQRVELYMSLARDSALEGAQDRVLDSHGAGSLSQFTTFVAEDIGSRDAKLSSTALFMCLACRRDLYRHFEAGAIAESCARSIEASGGRSALAIRALGKTLACSHALPSASVASGTLGEDAIRALVECAHGVARSGGAEDAAAASVCALRAVDHLVSSVARNATRRRPQQGLEEGASGESGGAESKHFSWNAFRHRRSFERGLRRVLAESLVGRSRCSQFERIVSAVHDHSRGLALSCARSCLEFCGVEDEFHRHAWLQLVRRLSLLDSPSPATRQEACLLVLSLARLTPSHGNPLQWPASGGEGLPASSDELVELAFERGLDLMDLVKKRATGPVSGDLVRALLKNAPLLSPNLTTGQTLRIGLFLRASLQHRFDHSAATAAMSGEELDLVASWVARTAEILFDGLKRSGDWTSGASIAESLGLLTEKAKVEEGRDGFRDVIFACVTDCICHCLKNEAIAVEVVDPVNTAYAQEQRHADLLLWLEIAVKCLDEFGVYKDGSLSVNQDNHHNTASFSVHLLALAAYSNLLHACLSVAHALRERPECAEKAQFLGQLLRHLIYDMLNDFKAVGRSAKDHKIVYLDALHSFVCHCDVVNENLAVLKSAKEASEAEASMGNLANQGEKSLGGREIDLQAMNVSLVGKIVHVLKEVLLARCMDLDQRQSHAPSDFLNRMQAESLASLCTIAEAYVLRCLKRIKEFSEHQQKIMGVIFVPVIEVLREFGQSERLDSRSREEVGFCVENILRSVNSHQIRSLRQAQSQAEPGLTIEAAVSAMPPTLLALPKGGVAAAGLGKHLSRLRFSCLRAVADTWKQPYGARQSVLLDDWTEFHSSQRVHDGCKDRFDEIFPRKRILSCQGDLIRMSVACTRVDAKESGDLRSKDSNLHVCLHFEVRSARLASFEKALVTFGVSGPCRTDKRVVELRGVAENTSVRFDILMDVFSFGKCTVAPNVVLFPAAAGDAPSSAKKEGIRFYSDGLLRFSPSGSHLSLAAEGRKTIEHSFGHFDLDLGMQFRSRSAAAGLHSPSDIHLGDFHQLWTLLPHETKAELAEQTPGKEALILAENLAKELNFDCVSDPLEIRRQIDGGAECVRILLAAETFDDQVLLCAITSTQLMEGGREGLYATTLHFKASASRVVEAIARDTCVLASLNNKSL